MKPTVKISTAIAVGALTVSTMASTAEASTTTTIATVTAGAQLAAALTGSCNGDDGIDGSFTVYYDIGGNGARNIHRFDWNITGVSLGNRNNVRLRIRKELRGRPDATIREWNSKDNVRRGNGSQVVNWSIPPGDIIHADVRFVFDRWGFDPSCTARSRSIARPMGGGGAPIR